MMRDSLKGLECKNIKEILYFDEKLSEFLNSLDEELKTWHDYVEKNGKRNIPYPIAGFACLDGEKIVGLQYFSDPKKFSVRYFIDLLFHSKEVGEGVVVKKEYHRRGIGQHLWNSCRDLLLKMGYERIYHKTDPENIAIIKWNEKIGSKIVRKKKDRIHYVINLTDDDNVRSKIALACMRVIIDLMTLIYRAHEIIS
jgi:ribosomal protein S18 acetylase RimI-like enzyme